MRARTKRAHERDVRRARREGPPNAQSWESTVIECIFVAAHRDTAILDAVRLSTERFEHGVNGEYCAGEYFAGVRGDYRGQIIGEHSLCIPMRPWRPSRSAARISHAAYEAGCLFTVAVCFCSPRFCYR